MGTEKPPIHGCPLRSAESSRKTEAPKSFAQGPYIAGGPPEDPITPPVCSYQKSEDGTSCDKVVVPCQENGEVQTLKSCPARSGVSSRAAEPPVVKKVELPDMAPVAKPEPALAQTGDEKKEEKKSDKKVTKKE